MNAAQQRQVDILEIFAEGQQWARLELAKREANIRAYFDRMKALDNLEQYKNRRVNGKEAVRCARKYAAKAAARAAAKAQRAQAAAQAEEEVAARKREKLREYFRAFRQSKKLDPVWLEKRRAQNAAAQRRRVARRRSSRLT